ncbi:MAG: hypothetical protein IJX89_02600 [Alphaproteobacteria bacterium]|nr:hypothetical protein [Alphaproteobacteria bacterium]
MKHRIANFCRFSVVLATFLGGASVSAQQAPNPRSATATNVAPARSDGRIVSRGNAKSDSSQNVISSSRSAIRRPSAVASRSAVKSVSAPSARNAARATIVANTRPTATTARAASDNVVRGAVSHTGASNARSAISGLTASRAATARATAVFSDVSKIGGGYASCRDSYATCMDQFCANANDTYRRCYCSTRFTEFRDTEDALDQAKVLLQKFEDNNLNAVDKTAAEVNAMYTATVGEAAIKNDTSGAQSILNEIGDLLSGKKKATTTSNTTSLGIMSLDFSSDIGDVWGEGGGSSIFSSGSSAVDMTSLEGLELYEAAHKQCMSVIGDSCESSAVLNMSKSAYGIMITQDCNAYEKSVNAKREAVESTVRQAEKYLREARLEEYRAHNSQDVNECIAKVKSAIVADTACGENYKRCLDYSGKYVSPVTGEATMSTSLFKLTEQITLTGSSDVLGDNPSYDSFLDEKRKFAATALDTCRDLADVVWTEFKRSALIEIAQAQEELIEDVKSSCVSTMAECYDTQSNALKEFDNTTAQAAGAISAYAAKSMCQDRVTRCAALYSPTGCVFDSSSGKLKNEGTCGLTALLEYVRVVDDVRVAEGCAGAIDGYVKELCTPTSGTKKFPWNCRLMSMGDVDGTDHNGNSVATLIRKFAVEHCSNPTADQKDYNSLAEQTKTQVRKAVQDIEEQLDYQLMETCEDLDGYWLEENTDNVALLDKFYSDNFAGRSSEVETSVGYCVENTTRTQCLNYNTGEETAVATYDLNKDECIFSDAWYQTQCETIGGYYDNGVCYVGKEE